VLYHPSNKAFTSYLICSKKLLRVMNKV